MLAVARRLIIKEQLSELKSVKVSDLAKQFSVTEETVRRDLKALEEEGVVSRTYGGAFILDGVQNDIDINLRQVICTEEKTRIAEKCQQLISHGDSIFLDVSTTSLFIAKQILNKRITVITNSLKIANLLKESSTVNLILTGGVYVPHTMSFVGHNARLTLERYFVDKTFISCRSLSIENGVTDSNEQEAEIRGLAVSRCQSSFLVADYTKFDKTSFASICPVKDLGAVICDRRLSPEWEQYLITNNVKII